MERPATNRCNGRWNIDCLNICAVFKHIVCNLSNSCRYGYACQLRTICKYALICACNSNRISNTRKIGTAFKCRASDCGYAARNHQIAGQISAAHKSRMANAGQAIRKVQGSGQAGALEESTVANTDQAVWGEQFTVKAGAAIESVALDHGHAGRNDDAAGQAATV